MARTIYACEICDQRYDTEAEALACEAKGRPQQIVQVGDIVTAKSGYGWYDGDTNWIANYDKLGNPPRSRKKHGNCFRSCCTYQFYYVVTHVEPSDQVLDRHRSLRYHLATRAMLDSGGWTTSDGSHFTPRFVKPQPRHLDTSGLIGKRFEHLL